MDISRNIVFSIVQVDAVKQVICLCASGRAGPGLGPGLKTSGGLGPRIQARCDLYPLYNPIYDNYILDLPAIRNIQWPGNEIGKYFAYQAV